jgi:hypothetical protein
MISLCTILEAEHGRRVARAAAYLGGLVLLAPRGALAFNAACAFIGAVLAVAMFFPWLKGKAVPALTDHEAQQLLEESRSDFAGFEPVTESAAAELRGRE